MAIDNNNTADKTSRSKRQIVFCIKLDDKAIIKIASDKLGLKLAGFSRMATMEKANSIIHNSEVKVEEQQVC